MKKFLSKLIQNLRPYLIPLAKKNILKKSFGFSLVELLIAIGISAVVITTAIGTIGNIHFSQKKIMVSQDFYSESRFLMERIVQIIRNNTIDYDRYFVEIGPSNEEDQCENFDEKQIPAKFQLESGFPEEFNDYANTHEHREALGYLNIFYWDTDDNGEPDRNLGGHKPNPTAPPDTIPDPCTVAWNGSLTNLYLINGSRNLRTYIRRNGDGEIQIEKQLGADQDNDGKIDAWTSYSQWNTELSKCELFVNLSLTIPLAGTYIGPETENFCNNAHPLIAISPPQIRIDDFSLELSPNRDPFLNFRVDEAQIHPQVFVFMDSSLRTPSDFGLNATNSPTISLQTSASSRVFGNTR